MSTRDEFEKWCKSKGLDGTRAGDYSGYAICNIDPRKEAFDAGWQASRAAALEEAAIAAWSEGMDSHGPYSRLMDPRDVGSLCAKRIRSLANPEGA